MHNDRTVTRKPCKHENDPKYRARRVIGIDDWTYEMTCSSDKLDDNGRMIKGHSCFEAAKLQDF